MKECILKYVCPYVHEHIAPGTLKFIYIYVQMQMYVRTYVHVIDICTHKQHVTRLHTTAMPRHTVGTGNLLSSENIVNLLSQTLSHEFSVQCPANHVHTYVLYYVHQY